MPAERTDELHESYAVRPVNPDRRAAIERHATGSVLDVGCGSGGYVIELDRDDAVGIDAAVFGSWSRAPGRFAIADATALPFRDHSFDTVLVFETLEHLADPSAALAEYRRVCRSRLVLTVPNCELTPGMRASNLIYHHWIDPSHRSFFTLDSLRALVAATGFDVVEAALVNRIDLAPLLVESFRLPAGLRRVLTRLLRVLQRPYRMTCLVVAEPQRA